MNGLLLINKPKGLTSHDVVNKVRKIANEKKVGHTGTLDPNASGLLILCLGEATKLIPYIEESNKIYEGVVTFGKRTTTDDCEGEILESKPIDSLDINDVTLKINDFLGEIEQVPPIYSAKKINGKKLYDYARQNKDIEIKPSKVTINKISIIDSDDFPSSLTLLVDCEKGTYIRALARDLGESLDNFAYLEELKRIKTNGRYLDQSIDLEDLNEETLQKNLISLDKILTNLPRINIRDNALKFLLNGNQLLDHNLKETLENYDAGETVALYNNGKLYGIGIIKVGNTKYIQPKKLIKNG